MDGGLLNQEDITMPHDHPMQSDAVDKLAAALAKAQASIGHAREDGFNPHFKSKFATLSSVVDACRRPLADNGLAVIQATEDTDDGSVVVVTTLTHASGQWMRGRLRMRPEKPGPQAVGVVITYARRYALAAMVGVAVSDDDAEAAENRTTAKAATRKATTKSKKAEPSPYMTRAQAQKLRERALKAHNELGPPVLRTVIVDKYGEPKSAEWWARIPADDVKALDAAFDAAWDAYTEAADRTEAAAATEGAS